MYVFCRPALIIFIFLSSLQASSAAMLSLHEAIKQAKEINPDIRSLKNQVASAEAKMRQAIAPTEPSLSLTYNDLRQPFGIPYQASTVYQFTQPVAFPGKAFANRSILYHQSQSISQQLRAKELDVANSVKTAYWQLALAKKNIFLNSETRATYERITSIAKRRYEAGSITQVDVLYAQMTLYSSNNDLIDLEVTERGARALLNTLLGYSIETPLEVEGLDSIARPELMTLKKAQERMLVNRPEILSAQEQFEAASSSYTLAKMSLLPDFQFTAGATHYDLAAASPISSTSDQSQTYLVGIQMTFPLWGLFNEREGIKSASHDQAVAEFGLRSLQQQSKVAVYGAIDGLEALRKKIDSYETHLLKLSEQAFNLAMVSYSSGKIDFQALSDAATLRRNTKRDHYALIVNYLTSYSQFGQLIGEELQP